MDDDPVVLSLLRHALEGAGIESHTASDGASGLRKLVDHLLELDLLVTDLKMPGLDGASLVRIIRAEGGERELPILVLASTASAADRDLLARLGVNAILEKSAGPDRVVATARALVDEARSRRPAEPIAGEERRVAVARVGLQRVPSE